MLSKKLNDPFYWKNKLEGLDSLPGVSDPEKSMLWEKLADRLQEKPQKRKAIWYWAAAGLVPLLIIILTGLNNTGNDFVKQAAVKNENITVPDRFQLPTENLPVVISASLPVEKKTTGPGNRKKDKKMMLVNTVKPNRKLINDVAQRETKPGLTINKQTPESTTIAVTTIVEVEKKLQVVHINELESFPVQYIKPADYTNSLVYKRSGKKRPTNQIVTAKQHSVGFSIKLSTKN